MGTPVRPHHVANDVAARLLAGLLRGSGLGARVVHREGVAAPVRGAGGRERRAAASGQDRRTVRMLGPPGRWTGRRAMDSIG